GKIVQTPILDHVAAVSVGIVRGVPLLDLDYPEDSACSTDMNVVMTGAGRFVEVQGTAEGAAFSRQDMDALLNLAENGIRELVAMQQHSLLNK
ncbi:MAG: ribonuclease PH, partial [Polaromonas sp.]|nr:ribonuclease PH [Polaromonas sp.]